jgi:AcrR family transcriptional regulator
MTGQNADASTETPDRSSVNHRTLVGKRRRAKTETKIIHAAVKVFAELGPDAPVIDDFIKAAGIARGTFYNYFRSTDELLRATSDFLTEELVMRIDKEIRSFKDPATRFGIGIRLWMRWAVDHPSWCLFLAQVWNSIKYELPIGDLRKGIAKKTFFAPDPYVAWDVISGAVRQAMFRIAEGNTACTYGNSVAQMCLQALGVPAEIIKDIMAMPLPNVPRGDLCQQTPGSSDLSSPMAALS